MPYLSSNIPHSIFYSALVGEFLRIARSSYLFADFQNKAEMLILRMITQGGNKQQIKKSLCKIITRHFEQTFFRFQMSVTDIINTFSL